MHIIEIILDGFKSYSTRTVVGEFDPQFNAITGLNGSGKSNILDAICFVLGISQLRNVRAENLQELIYKQGNSGVQKASVTITFDNSNKEQSPQGYEDQKRIQVTRTVDSKSKYYINGRSETAEKVKSLFCSVQLNINNPHFLIMQGRVTKVINMKPMEILGLIEEAAGISLYQKKREETFGIIAKKDNKIAEINQLLEQEVTPQLEKLKAERETFQQYKSNEAQLEDIMKQIVAFDYYEYRKVVLQKDTFEENYQRENAQLQHDLNEINREIQNLKANMSRLDGQGEEQKIIVVKNEIEEQKRRLYAATIDLQNYEKSEQSLLQTMKKCNKEMEGSNLAISKLERRKKELKDDSLEQLENELSRLKEQIRENENQITQLKAGKNVTNLEDDLIAQGKELEAKIAATGQKKRAVGKERQLKLDSLNSLEKAIQEKQNDQMQQQNIILDIQNQIQYLSQQKNQKSNTLSYLSDLQSKMSSLDRQIEDLQPEFSKFQQIAQRISFNYRPIPNLDGRLVKGKVINLIKVPDYKKYGSAIDGVAGGQLFSVLVANEIVSKELLRHNAVPYRVSYIPLNKIRGEGISSADLARVKQLAGDKARLALDLIEYDEELEPAMKFIFGNTVSLYFLNFQIIVDDEVTAKKVTYNLRMRSVTLKGDTYNPSGVLSGGFSETGQLVKQVQELKALEEKRMALLEEKRRIDFELQPCLQQQRAHEDICRNLHDLETKLRIYQDKERKSTKEGFEEENLQNCKEEISDLERKLNQLDENEKNLYVSLGQLKKEVENVKKQGDSAKSKEEFYQKKIAQLKKQRSQVEDDIKNAEQQGQQVELQIEDAQKKWQEANQSLQKAKSQHEEQATLLKRQAIFRSEEEGKLADLNEKLQKVESENVRKHSERNKLSNQVNSRTEQAKDIETKIKQAEETVKKFLGSVQNSRQHLKKLEEENKWIQNESDFFGQKGTKYDFQRINIHKLKEEQKNLRENTDELKKRVNPKVDAMFEETEQQYDKLKVKKELTLQNKKDLEKVIADLDQQKNLDIEKTWKQVNRYCSEIYSTLLQGANAKLAPPVGKTVHEGLELKVAFSGTWKESLSELSGGQRSLLALSLILALLKYHPAPLYILDEIDSALDLSHTQNIGIMIRKFFDSSQFVIVSLKEGLFQNANVLFKVSFYDNKSSVKRFQVRKNDSKNEKKQALAQGEAKSVFE